MYNQEITALTINFMNYQTRENKAKYNEPKDIQVGDVITLDDGCDYKILKINIYNDEWKKKMEKYHDIGNLIVKKPRGRVKFSVILTHIGDDVGVYVNVSRMHKLI
jgi:hypothetical protein